MAALIDVNSIVPPVSQIVSDQLINYVNTVKNGSVTDLDVGSKLWTFVYTSGRQKVDLYYKLYQFKKQSFVLYATGKYLDLHGQERGVLRLEANYAEGIATFYREQASPIELKIAQGVEITTTSESSEESVITFVTTAAGSIPVNQLSVEIPIRCTVPGEDGNLASGALNRMPTPPIGVHRVVTTSTSGGTVQENDEDYRARIIVALESLGKGTLSAITNAVMGVQGIRTVTITDPTKITVGGEYYMEDTNSVKCAHIETLNATIGVNRVTLSVGNGGEASTKKVEIWSTNENEVEITETFDNINNFKELVDTINSTKKKYILTDGTRPILELYSIQPEGAPSDNIYLEILKGTNHGLKYIFRIGNDIRTIEIYDNIDNVGQLISALESSNICYGNAIIQWKENLSIIQYVEGDDDLNYVIPTYQPITALLPDQEDQDGTPYTLGWIDDSQHELGQKITVFVDTGIANVGYIYNASEFSPMLIGNKLSIIFSNYGSNLVKASMYGEKTSTSDLRKIYQIMAENEIKNPKDIVGSGSLGQYLDVVQINKPGSITVLPVPHALPMSNDLRNAVEAAINEVKAAGIEVIIEEPKVEFVDVSIAVGINIDVGADENAIKEQIRENLTNYINGLEQDEPAYWERLVAQANPDIEGLLYTEVVSPSTDILAPVGGFLRAGDISFGD
jgi:hypothetical protein